jgi:hypothetical protein
MKTEIKTMPLRTFPWGSTGGPDRLYRVTSFEIWGAVDELFTSADTPGEEHFQAVNRQIEEMRQHPNREAYEAAQELRFRIKKP